ncbi:MAG TPA: aminotransferase class III-fold pyridoxal phosphate-dependent enzyme [Nitrososphaeraceae archaeon]
MISKSLKDLYKKKTHNSKKIYDYSVKIFPGGISHNIRFFRPYPFFVSKARDKHLFDVDGNKYVDYWMGHWALILGHSPNVVVKNLDRQIRQGTLYGTANDISIKLGDIIKKSIPISELLRFCTTGSEATMYAIRIARAVTKKRIICKTIGGWHGFNTDLMQSVNYPFEIDEGVGMTGREGDFVESIPFNELDRSIKLLDNVKDELACIIIEPLLGGGGCIPANINYLKGLEEFCKRNDILFILDEIVTGFRLNFGSVSSLYHLDPDMITLGKIVGGGLPIGVVCGKKEIMKVANPVENRNKEQLCYIGGGTFSSNPLTMTAGYATLDYINKNRQMLYNKINKLGDAARNGLRKIFSDYGLKTRVTGIGSLFLTHFLSDEVNDITNANDVALSDIETLTKYHFSLMAKYGIFFLPHKMGAISIVHDVKDIQSLINATQKIIESDILMKIKN